MCGIQILVASQVKFLANPAPSTQLKCRIRARWSKTMIIFSAQNLPRQWAATALYIRTALASQFEILFDGIIGHALLPALLRPLRPFPLPVCVPSSFRGRSPICVPTNNSAICRADSRTPGASPPPPFPFRRTVHILLTLTLLPPPSPRHLPHQAAFSR
jgi:hypothetical protein